MSKKAGAKKIVSRMFDLEVDEVSAVDKPAIAEEFIVTKSVDGKETNLKNKKVGAKKNEEGKPAGAAAADPATAQPGADGAGNAASDIPAGSEAGAADPAAPAAVPGGEAGSAGASDPASSEDDSEDGDEGEGDGEGEGDDAGDKTKSLDEEVASVRKEVSELQDTLNSMLEVHEFAAGAMNALVAMTFTAIEMCSSMTETVAASAAVALTEDQKKKFDEIKKSMSEVKPEVQKAGAKISASRLATLQEIATKLAGLLSEVSEEAGKVGKKKSASEESVSTLSKQVEELQTSLKSAQEDSTKAKEEVAKMANRLGELEGQSGTSSAVDDDEEDGDEPASSQTKSKSVFANLIPTQDIVKRVRERDAHKAGTKKN